MHETQHVDAQLLSTETDLPEHDPGQNGGNEKEARRHHLGETRARRFRVVVVVVAVAMRVMTMGGGGRVVTMVAMTMMGAMMPMGVIESPRLALDDGASPEQRDRASDQEPQKWKEDNRGYHPVNPSSR